MSDVPEDIRSLVAQLNGALSRASAEGYRVDLEVQTLREHRLGYVHEIRYNNVVVQIFKEV